MFNYAGLCAEISVLASVITMSASWECVKYWFELCVPAVMRINSWSVGAVFFRMNQKTIDWEFSSYNANSREGVFQQVLYGVFRIISSHKCVTGKVDSCTPLYYDLAADTELLPTIIVLISVLMVRDIMLYPIETVCERPSKSSILTGTQLQFVWISPGRFHVGQRIFPAKLRHMVYVLSYPFCLIAIGSYSLCSKRLGACRLRHSNG